MRGQEQLVALRACGKGMILEILRYADEVNAAAGFFRGLDAGKPDTELLELAEALIEKRSGEFNAAVHQYNTAIAEFPAGLIARLWRFRPARGLDRPLPSGEPESGRGGH